jgi:hypothetical protein
VNGRGDESLPRSRFAAEEHRRIGFRDQLDTGHDVAQAVALTDYGLGLGRVRPRVEHDGGRQGVHAGRPSVERVGIHLHDFLESGGGAKDSSRPAADRRFDLGQIGVSAK